MIFKLFKHKKILSERLTIAPITIKDAAFVLQLFNTKGWLKYIGDRNIHSIIEAENFIINAITNDNAVIWTITVKEKPRQLVGVITLIKRDYLNFPDIGYALLPNAMGFGYAHEATQAVINDIKTNSLFEQLNAITLIENAPSINLLKKLNFNFEKEILENNESLSIYELTLYDVL
jgi:RimJ/RimL family protein N-acetyltransferase